MKPKINTFIFDCFGVFFTPVIGIWYEENRKKYGFVDENFNNVLKEFDLNHLSETDLTDYFSKYKGINLNKEKIQEEIDNYLKLDSSLIDIIKKLKYKGYKIALLSNGNASFFNRKIYPNYPEFKVLFDEIIISSDIGMVKPDKDIFLYTLNKINIKIEAILFIDDRKINVDSATALGINGFVYTDSNSFNEYIKNLGIDL